MEVRPGQAVPDNATEGMWVHQSVASSTGSCPFHGGCDRVPLASVAADFAARALCPADLHSLCRIMQASVDQWAQTVLGSAASGIQGCAFKRITEWTNSPHAGIVMWRAGLTREQGETLERLQHSRDTAELGPDELEPVMELARQCVTVARTAAALQEQFGQLAGGEAEEIAVLANKYQQHCCSHVCRLQERDHHGQLCRLWSPWLPAATVVLPVQPPPFNPAEEARLCAIERLTLRLQDHLRMTEHEESEDPWRQLADLLVKLFGPVLPGEEDGVIWAGVSIPEGAGWVSMWNLMVGKLVVFDAGNAEDVRRVDVLAGYHSLLGTRRQPRFIHQRRLSEVWTVSYNPLALASWRGSMCVEVLSHTVNEAFMYVTKGGASDLNVADLLHVLRRRGGQHDGAALAHLEELVAPEGGNCEAMGTSEAMAVLDRRIQFTHTFPSSVIDPKADLPWTGAFPEELAMKQEYAARPRSLFNCCYAQFVQWYRPAVALDGAIGERPSIPLALPLYLEPEEPRFGQDGGLPPVLVLEGGLGEMRLRRAPRILARPMTAYGDIVLYQVENI